MKCFRELLYLHNSHSECIIKKERFIKYISLSNFSIILVKVLILTYKLISEYSPLSGHEVLMMMSARINKWEIIEFIISEFAEFKDLEMLEAVFFSASSVQSHLIIHRPSNKTKSFYYYFRIEESEQEKKCQLVWQS